jgi:hypothetical protein
MILSKLKFTILCILCAFTLTYTHVAEASKKDGTCWCKTRYYCANNCGGPVECRYWWSKTTQNHEKEHKLSNVDTSEKCEDREKSAMTCNTNTYKNAYESCQWYAQGTHNDKDDDH